jgi:hypothetical protein
MIPGVGGLGWEGDPNSVLHISSSWVKVRLATKNQHPRFPESAVKVWGGVVADVYIRHTL